jgi:CheY-like chemotaxis protein
MELNPILIIDDDADELEMIKEASECLQLNRPILFFRSGDEFINYLKSATQAPFLIISDVNLGAIDGFALKKKIVESRELKYISVPYIFWSTSASEKQIQYAYDLPVQGFFFKSNNFNDLCETLKIMIEYWQRSQHPKQVK